MKMRANKTMKTKTEDKYKEQEQDEGEYEEEQEQDEGLVTKQKLLNVCLDDELAVNHQFTNLISFK